MQHTKWGTFTPSTVTSAFHFNLQRNWDEQFLDPVYIQASPFQHKCYFPHSNRIIENYLRNPIVLWLFLWYTKPSPCEYGQISDSVMTLDALEMCLHVAFIFSRNIWNILTCQFHFIIWKTDYLICFEWFKFINIPIWIFIQLRIPNDILWYHFIYLNRSLLINVVNLQFTLERALNFLLQEH